MADVYAFLELDGIKGEAKDKDFENKIALESFSWGAANNSSFATGTGAGIGKGQIQDMQFSQHTNVASMNLMKYCVEGKHIPKGTVTLVKLHGTEKLKYLEIKMEHVVVTSFHVGASGDGQLPSESFTLHFAKIKAAYQAQKDDGTKGDNVPFDWDLQTNSES